MVEYPVSEAVDKYTILVLKKVFRAGGSDIESQLDKVDEYLLHKLGEAWEIAREVARIASCNALQWMLEAELADDADSVEADSAEKVARAALEIRISNLLRVQAKNALAVRFGEFIDSRVMYAGVREVSVRPEPTRFTEVRKG